MFLVIVIIYLAFVAFHDDRAKKCNLSKAL